MVDHFEPGTQNVSLDLEKTRMNGCLQNYPKLTNNHKDYSGNIPKRTWFFPPHYHRHANLKQLAHLFEKNETNNEFSVYFYKRKFSRII